MLEDRLLAALRRRDLHRRRAQSGSHLPDEQAHEGTLGNLISAQLPTLEARTTNDHTLKTVKTAPTWHESGHSFVIAAVRDGYTCWFDVHVGAEGASID